MASPISVLGSHVSVLWLTRQCAGVTCQCAGSHVSVLGCHPAPVKVDEEQMVPKTFCRQIQGIVGVLGQVMMGEQRGWLPQQENLRSATHGSLRPPRGDRNATATGTSLFLAQVESLESQWQGVAG